ncbi:hypothetical protein [Ottowia beijingensis]|uniref:hypothetical protein n=1 Tax=Ottowia beijingensis TaxID=1207057 RepID=UPI002FDA8941
MLVSLVQLAGQPASGPDSVFYSGLRLSANNFKTKASEIVVYQALAAIFFA